MRPLRRGSAWAAIVALCGCGDGPGPVAHEQVSVAALPPVSMKISDDAFAQRLDAALRHDPFRGAVEEIGIPPASMAGFSVRQLVPRGVLSDRHGRFALVETAEGRVVRVAVGDAIGEERAKVVAFDAMGLTLELPGEVAERGEGERVLRLLGAEPQR
ncbi:pilus assembly protein PilP [Halotalea alkalilenta]|uniref:pilus assembly protein PilP n=1 Tax=Halotalea alkalilenta TaxID=376489 RepID=UPI0012DF7812|nr:pilus assembly protein PilP [Halotalea alkalilenta]